MENHIANEPRPAPKYYNQTVKACIDRYRERHAEQINAYSREYYRKKYADNPQYREMKKQKALARYYAKKAAAAEVQNAAVGAQ
jgi:hypothetical protein